MLRLYKTFFLTAALFSLSACSSLAVMKRTENLATPDDGHALVKIVRPSVFLGDGVKYRAWNGTEFLGMLEAGTMIQYMAAPGEHVFMVDPVQGAKWARYVLQVEPGKTYYLKPNQIPFAGVQMGLAEPDDERISTWESRLKPLTIDQSRSQPVPPDYIKEAETQMQQANAADDSTT